MTYPNKPISKPSRVAKMSVKPIWRKNLNPCNTSNELNVSSPTPMPKPLIPYHEPSQENNHPNHASPNPYIKDTFTSLQVVSHPPFPISPINSHVTHTQAPPQSDNQTQHTPPLSPSRESLVDDINQLQDLSNLLIVEIVLWYLDSGCSKHMTDNGTSSSTLFPCSSIQSDSTMIILQFCDSDLEVAFRKHTCFVRNLEGVDLLSGSRGKNLYTILLEDMMKSSPICLLSKASKTKPWLWHRRLSHLNFSIVNQLEKEGLVKDDAYGSLWTNKSGSINGKRYILVIIDDYSSLGPEPQLLTFGQISSKLIPNQAASTSAKPPSKNDLDLLFQTMFDEYFKPSPSFVSPTISAATLSQDTVGETSSTTIDHDAPF
ncbi:integrase, catalytic region, zinc finger, CCHC-type containing protein [Tanacetum coccineum]